MNKRLLFIGFLFFTLSVKAQRQYMPPLFSSDFTVTRLDTLSIDRQVERVFFYTRQYPHNDYNVKNYLKQFARSSEGWEITDVFEFKNELGCDCETQEMKLILVYPKFEAKGKIGGTIPHPSPFTWPKYNNYKIMGGLNDSEQEIYNAVCSKYIYRVDSLAYELYIEEIPKFLQKYPDAILESKYIEKLECNLPYLPLESFNNDTIRFLEYNFNERAICYRFKKLEHLLEDLMIEPEYCFLDFGYYNTSKGIWLNIGDSLNSAYLIIEWRDWADSREYYKLSKDHISADWSDEIYNVLKDMIVARVLFYTRDSTD